MSNFVIYKHTNKINGKCYIGKTCCDPEKRWKLGSGYRRHIKFYNAILKYGWDNFTHEILETNLTDEEAKKREIYYIQFYDSFKNGYNATLGGDGGVGHSYTPTEETRQKIREERSKQVFTEETKRKMSEARKGRPGYTKGYPAWNKGLTWNEETREKMRQAKLGKPNWKSKTFICLNNGKIYMTAKQCEKDIGVIMNGHIRDICLGKRKSYKGFQFRYLDQ